MKSNRINPARVRAVLALNGISVRQWAKKKRFPEKTVYAVISGARSGRRSQGVVAALLALQSVEKTLEALARE